MARPSDGIQAVVLDLFGTLVAAPRTADRLRAVSLMAGCMDVSPSAVDDALTESWPVRHNGQLGNRQAIASHLAAMCAADQSAVPVLSDCLRGLAVPRLLADQTVLDAVQTLRETGIRVGVLSDVAADVAEAWLGSDLAARVDAVVFSCRAGKTKPHPKLYEEVLGQLGTEPSTSVYCGDGGGSELDGARHAGMRAVRVRRRGGPEALSYGETAWTGLTISAVEDLPALLASGHLR
ncbi:MAG: HAD family hydrolase [Micromonosporaceae bacterium]